MCGGFVSGVQLAPAFDDTCAPCVREPTTMSPFDGRTTTAMVSATPSTRVHAVPVVVLILYRPSEGLLSISCVIRPYSVEPSFDTPTKSSVEFFDVVKPEA